MNDRYLDLAVLANFVVTNETEEKDYLREYFGEAASEYRLARFYLMRQILHMSYAAVFFLFGSPGKAVEANAKVPAFRDFHNRVWAGEISLAGAEAKVQYARVHLTQASQDMRSARFQEALRIVGDNHVGA